jgi:hypothetical protein
MKRNMVRFSLALTALMFIASCTMLGLDKTPSQKQIVTSMYQVYNAQHEDYMVMAASPTTTEAQKVIMRQKKPILDKLATLIPMYDAAVNAGTATPEMQKEIMTLLNSLQ